MTRTTREDWLDEGLRILEGEGDGAVTVDTLCARLDRSKGSFYHHFSGRDGYVRALLQRWEREATDRFIETGHADAPVAERLRRMNRQASEMGNARVERAIRGWATREPLAREVQDRVDARRLALLEELCGERMGAAAGARHLARVLHLTFVGAQHLNPPLEGDELYGTFRFLEPLFDL